MSNTAGTPSQASLLREEKTKVPQQMWGCPWDRDGFPLAAGFLPRLWGCAKGGTARPSTTQGGRLGLHVAAGSVSPPACPSARKRCVEGKTSDFPQMQSCWRPALPEAFLVEQEVCVGDRRHAGTQLGQDGHLLPNSLWDMP